MKFAQFLIYCAALSVAGWAQSSSSPDSPKAETQKPDTKEAQLQPASEEAIPVKNNNQLHLTAINIIVAPSEVASGLGGGGLQCDGDGNLYLESDSAKYPGIRKLNSKGELVAFFKPDTNPDVKVEFAGDFFVTSDGEVYQWVG